MAVNQDDFLKRIHEFTDKLAVANVYAENVPLDWPLIIRAMEPKVIQTCAQLLEEASRLMFQINPIPDVPGEYETKEKIEETVKILKDHGDTLFDEIKKFKITPNFKATKDALSRFVNAIPTSDSSTESVSNDLHDYQSSLKTYLIDHDVTTDRIQYSDVLGDFLDYMVMLADKSVFSYDVQIERLSILGAIMENQYDIMVAPIMGAYDSLHILESDPTTSKVIPKSVLDTIILKKTDKYIKDSEGTKTRRNVFEMDISSNFPLKNEDVKYGQSRRQNRQIPKSSLVISTLVSQLYELGTVLNDVDAHMRHIRRGAQDSWVREINEMTSRIPLLLSKIITKCMFSNKSLDSIMFDLCEDSQGHWLFYNMMHFGQVDSISQSVIYGQKEFMKNYQDYLDTSQDTILDMRKYVNQMSKFAKNTLLKPNNNKYPLDKPLVLEQFLYYFTSEHISLLCKKIADIADIKQRNNELRDQLVLLGHAYDLLHENIYNKYISNKKLTDKADIAFAFVLDEIKELHLNDKILRKATGTERLTTLANIELHTYKTGYLYEKKYPNIPELRTDYFEHGTNAYADRYKNRVLWDGSEANPNDIVPNHMMSRRTSADVRHETKTFTMMPKSSSAQPSRAATPLYVSNSSAKPKTHKRDDTKTTDREPKLITLTYSPYLPVQSGQITVNKYGTLADIRNAIKTTTSFREDFEVFLISTMERQAKEIEEQIVNAKKRGGLSTQEEENDFRFKSIKTILNINTVAATLGAFDAGNYRILHNGIIISSSANKDEKDKRLPKGIKDGDVIQIV